MADGSAHIDLAAKAIGEAGEGIAEIAPPKRRKLGRRVAAAPGKVPAVKQSWLPVSIIAVLFIGQVVAAITVNDTTIGTVFAAGAVIVAVLAAIVAVLSYAQQSSVPLADIVEVLEKLLTGLEELKKAHEAAHPSTDADAKNKTAGGDGEKPAGSTAAGDQAAAGADDDAPTVGTVPHEAKSAEARAKPARAAD